MRKIVIVLSLLLFFGCGDGVTQKDRCEYDVEEIAYALRPEFCILGLRAVRNFGQESIDFILLECIIYQQELSKCKSKSNLIPAGL